MSRYYDVFLVKSDLSVEDPDMPPNRHHTGIFVETGADGSGILHHVTGDITSSGGMHYVPTAREDPKRSQTFHSSQKLGVTPVSTHTIEWKRVLESLPTPPQQKAFNTQTMRTEPFKTKDPLTFYNPGEPKRPLMKCTEWTMEIAIPALMSHGLIIQQFIG